MSTDAFVENYVDHVVEVMRPRGLSAAVNAAADLLRDVKRAGKKIMLAGNGASASIASHFAVDFTKQVAVQALSFNDAALLTAYGNDYGFDQWAVRALEHHGEVGDAAILISSSGASPNMVNAADRCGDLRIRLITFTGFQADNPLRGKGDVNFWAASEAYNVIEGVHTIWLGLVCDRLIGTREYGVKG